MKRHGRRGHSYGFGAGGGDWVAYWAIAEILFVLVCWFRHKSQMAAAKPIAATPGANPGAVQST